MNPIRHTIGAACVASVFTLLPGYAYAAPNQDPKDVIKGPNIVDGARNAPGSQAITDLINTIGFYTLVACVLGFLLSCLILVIGPRLGFTPASTIGKTGIIASLGVAFLVGIAATLINYFYNAGA